MLGILPWLLNASSFHRKVERKNRAKDYPNTECSVGTFWAHSGIGGLIKRFPPVMFTIQRTRVDSYRMRENQKYACQTTLEDRIDQQEPITPGEWWRPKGTVPPISWNIISKYCDEMLMARCTCTRQCEPLPRLDAVEKPHKMRLQLTQKVQTSTLNRNRLTAVASVLSVGEDNRECPPCPSGTTPTRGSVPFCRVLLFSEVYRKGVREFRSDPNARKLLSLLQQRRSSLCPYLIQSSENRHAIDCGERQCTAAWERVFTRLDVLWSSPDLLDHKRCSDDVSQKLHGVVDAPVAFYHGPAIPPLHRKRRHILSYMGKCTRPWAPRACPSSVRPRLHRAFSGGYSAHSDISFVCSDAFGVADKNHGFRIDYNETARQQYMESLNSTFVLIPRGDNRWSYRFSEAIGACAIPVIIADGLQLPFGELIDWKAAAVFIPESEASDVVSVLRRLPPKEAWDRMLSQVCRINEAYFASQRKRTRALLNAAASVVSRAPRPQRNHVLSSGA